MKQENESTLESFKDPNFNMNDPQFKSITKAIKLGHIIKENIHNVGSGRKDPDNSFGNSNILIS